MGPGLLLPEPRAHGLKAPHPEWWPYRWTRTAGGSLGCREGICCVSRTSVVAQDIANADNGLEVSCEAIEFLSVQNKRGRRLYRLDKWHALFWNSMILRKRLQLMCCIG